MTDWLEEIDAHLDGTEPYYVPRLVLEVRRLRHAREALRAMTELVTRESLETKFHAHLAAAHAALAISDGTKPLP